MKPRLVGNGVAATCPECGAVVTFERVTSEGAAARFTRLIPIESTQQLDHEEEFILLRCAGCEAGAIAKINWYPSFRDGDCFLEWVAPPPIDASHLPEATPDDIRAEFREAEICVSVGAYRAATALLRSTLEKVLRKAGYDRSLGSLDSRINLAAQDGVLAEARKVQAHRNIRVLGNDVLHEDWRSVTEAECEASHMYTQRIIEDFYSDQDSVARVLRAKGRIPNGEDETVSC